LNPIFIFERLDNHKLFSFDLPGKTQPLYELAEWLSVERRDIVAIQGAHFGRDASQIV
jgi:hypothetical protein